MRNLRWLEDKKGNYDTLLRKIVQKSQATENRGRINTLYLFLTRKCNLGCSHCYINGVGPKAKDQDFDLNKIKSVVYQALDLGLKKVKISGGEPFFHKEILDILDFFYSLNLDEIVLETNSTLITDSDLEILKAIRNLTIFISLDHIKPKEHDDFRNRLGAFDKTVCFLEKLGGTNINSVVTTTAYKGNYKHVLEIIEFVLRIGIRKHRTLLNIHPLGNALQNLGNELNLEECVELMENIVASDFYRLGKAYLTMPPALTPISNLEKVKTCGWGDNVLGVLSTGEISMCSASYDDPQMIAGNLCENSLKEIWEGAFFNELRNIGTENVKGVCGNCILYEVCRGVCKMSSYSHYGEKNAPYPLCQEFYNNGLFPEYALINPEKDCSYGQTKLKGNKSQKNFLNKAVINRLINSI